MQSVHLSLSRMLDELFAERIGASAAMRIMQSAREGHLCVFREEIGNALDLLPPAVIGIGNGSASLAPIVRHEDRYYLQKNWVYETYILQQVKRLRQSPAPSYFDRTRFYKALEEACLAGKLSKEQGEAGRSLLDSCLTVISGGPGTGKTYTVSWLVQFLAAALPVEESACCHICLAAPTGKAAAHLQSIVMTQWKGVSTLQFETATLHRLLRLQPGQLRLASDFRIDADFVIVDEASMIDVPLLAHLLKAIGPDTMLLLLGDPHQLPPIETTSLFPEMARLLGSSLERCLRVEDAHLQQVACAVKEGNADTFDQLLDGTSSKAVRLDWEFSPLLAEKLFMRIGSLLSPDRPDPKAAWDHYLHVRILNAVRKGSYGTERLNQQIFSLLHNQAHSQNLWWAAPILATCNDPYAAIYNGMGGILIGRGRQIHKAYFPDTEEPQWRAFPSPPSYELSFCLSIHKSQGSEFDAVIALFPEGSERFGREAIYTALTRSKKKIEVVGKRETLRAMIARSSQKKTGFSARF
ncbi:MAG: AAA family ATPase [Chlamydiia bacterium]|nr:AAA family ATPase [Chlamydiia bacterium]